MSEPRYIFEKYKGMSTRHHCPQCKSREKTFTLYIDIETGRSIADNVGRCNRENNCGYHYTPKQYFHDNNIKSHPQMTGKVKQKPTTPPPPSYIPADLFKASLKGYQANHFITFLHDLFGAERTNQLISKYFIGTSRHWNGSTVFWQIDINNKVRTGKIMLYNATTGKRIKDPFDHINWVHSVAKLPKFELKQCLFGEHLLRDKTKPIAIVESEKTAIIASLYLPQFTWLAVGMLRGLNPERCQVLTGRSVVLFPDLKGFEIWQAKAKELSHITQFTVSDLLERKAPAEDKIKGLDLADYLIRLEPEPVPVPVVHNIPKPPPTEPITTPCQQWEGVNELIKYFQDHSITEPVQLDHCDRITDPALFIDSYIEIVKHNNGNETFWPYYDRLLKLRDIFKTVNNNKIQYHAI